MICFNKVSDAHHWRTKGSSQNDLYCVPLCREHHSMFHNIGVKSFCDKFKLGDIPYIKMIEFITEFINDETTEW